MAFDRQARLAATNAISLADLELQFGDVGLVNGARTWPNKRSTLSNEAYLGRRLVLYLVRTGRLSFPISVVHGDRPDLRIKSDDCEWLVEVTEACPAEEGHRFAQQTDGVFPIGDYSESGLEQAQRDLIAQIQRSIDDKSAKVYGADGNIALLVYPNSEASQWVGFFDRKPEELIARLDARSFCSVFVFWGNHFVEVSGNHP